MLVPHAEKAQIWEFFLAQKAQMGLFVRVRHSFMIRSIRVQGGVS